MSWNRFPSFCTWQVICRRDHLLYLLIYRTFVLLVCDASFPRGYSGTWTCVLCTAWHVFNSPAVFLQLDCLYLSMREDALFLQFCHSESMPVSCLVNLQLPVYTHYFVHPPTAVQHNASLTGCLRLDRVFSSLPVLANNYFLDVCVCRYLPSLKRGSLQRARQVSWMMFPTWSIGNYRRVINMYHWANQEKKKQVSGST